MCAVLVAPPRKGHHRDRKGAEKGNQKDQGVGEHGLQGKAKLCGAAPFGKKKTPCIDYRGIKLQNKDFM